MIVAREIKTSYHITSSTKTQITNLTCICANGNAMPPLIIYPGKSVNPSYAVDLPPGSLAYATESGWMNTEAFFFWIKNLFVANLPPIRPVVLLLDGHSSHIDYATGKFCRQNRIELICLPPHTSHVTQPLDKGIFGPFKHEYRKLCNEFCQTHPGTSVDKFTFGRVFGKSYMKVCNKENIVNSFRSTGLWPVNSEAVDYAKMESSKSFPVLEDISEQNTAVSEPHIPEYTPSASSLVPELCNSTVSTEFVCGSSAHDERMVHSNDFIDFSQTGSELENKSVVSKVSKNSVLGSSRLLNVNSIVVKTPQNASLPGCSKTVQFFASTPNPPKEKVSATCEALKSIESNLSNEQKILYRKRFEENYDLQIDTVYSAWKMMKLAVEKEEEDRRERIRQQCISTSSSAPARKELLKCPQAERKKVPSKKTNLSLHINSDESLAALEDKIQQKLDKEREIRDRKLARELKKAEQVRRQEEKGKKKNGKGKQRRIEVRSTKWRKVSNECDKCGGLYVGDEDEPDWIACEECESWFHVRCTDIGGDVDGEDLENLDFFCESCI